MKYFFYRLIAPILHFFYRNTITSKLVVYSKQRLYYNAGEHLSFFGKTKIDYEPEYRNIISKLIEPGNLIFDIGANIGQYSIFFSHATGLTGKIISIEPD